MLFNEAQLQLLDMMSFVKTPEALKELNRAVSDYFVKKADGEMSKMWDEAEVIARNISLRVSEAIVFAILTRPNILRVDPHFSFGLITADVDDNKFVDCAIVANARCIVTEDKHFSILNSVPFPKVDVMNIDSFVKLLTP